MADWGTPIPQSFLFINKKSIKHNLISLTYLNLVKMFKQVQLG